MQKVHKMTANWGVDVPDTPQNIFSCSALELKDQEINTIITERHQELDTVSHETLDLAHTVMDKTKDLGQQLAKKQDKIIESANLDKGLRLALEGFPTKVLSKIFDYYLMDSDHLSHRSSPSPMQLARRSQDDPLSLQLCPGYAKGGTAKLRQLVQPYMTRVSSLDIVFWDDVEPEHLLEDLPAGLQELTVCFGDWFDASAIAQSLSQLPSTCMRVTHTNLRSLCIICPGHFQFNPLPILFKALTLPKLRTLEIRYGLLSSPHEELLMFLRWLKCPLEILMFDTVVIPLPEQQGNFTAIIPTLKIEYSVIGLVSVLLGQLLSSFLTDTVAAKSGKVYISAMLDDDAISGVEVWNSNHVYTASHSHLP
ncbi:uncharacterized protein F5891DRAFT_986621 [Suillus fuscotomentosus]|uniref:Uncharacterized protein n=1 Tax=Suillus fuscotomentosus TaxID=1912939 RepID=A0AAD4HDI5_9AGAM|nr:uncharacterized protein F5891DRAFT_986621 [Suillus fuscotomentosus]KAG1891687.1 hypothetical protein F5891DRAFT_986621 [Suillus fuscotomentosus]